MTDPNQGQGPSWYTGGNDDATAGGYPANSAGQPSGGDPRYDHSQTAAQAGGYGLHPPQHPPAQAPSAQGFSPHGYSAQSYPPHGYSPQGYPPQGHAPHGYAPPGYGYYSPTPGSDELHRLSFEREQRAQQHATTAVVLGIIGLFTLPVILGPLAIWQASKARSLGHQATAGLVLGWIALLWGFTGWLFFAFFMMIGVILAF